MGDQLAPDVAVSMEILLSQSSSYYPIQCTRPYS